ncbi:hypothetical protein ACLB2K_071830 [Fragaria x ananassa]
MERILQMFEELKGRLEATATQQNVTDLAEKIDGLAEQAKRDKILWRADQHNLAIQKNLDQNTETVMRTTETLSLTRATVDEQARHLDEHDAKFQQQQDASFFGNKNNLEKLEEFKEKHDRLSLRVLELEDRVRSQTPKSPAFDLIGASKRVLM